MDDAVRPADNTVPLAEVVVAASLASDLAKGLPSGQALRTCLLATRLAESCGLDDDQRLATYYVALLRFIGCTGTAAEMAAALGDEVAVSALFAAVDPRDLREVLGAARTYVGSERSAARRVQMLTRFLARAPGVIREHEVASCEVAMLFAERLGLPLVVRAALGQVFERYDGHGNPGRSRENGLAAAVRVEQVAYAAELLWRTTGEEACLEVLSRRSGSSFDPPVVETLRSCPALLRESFEEPEPVAAVLARAPIGAPSLSGVELEAALAALGAVADLKSVHTRGHADSVARTAEAAAAAAGCSEDEVTSVRRAGWVHDLGRVAVSAAVWDAARPLTGPEWEEVRLHAYQTERVLARVPSLAGLARLAGSHHERADGSGYHRGLTAAQSEGPAALLAAADVYAALGESRPRRSALDQAARVRVLREEVEAGRLAGWAVDAVLAGAAGDRTALAAVAVVTPLTDREREVLVLVARGYTNRAAASILGVTPKTVNAHLEHVFRKLGVSSRAAATYYALQRGLIGG